MVDDCDNRKLKLLRSVFLEAEQSPGRAWYQIKMFQMELGFIVEKTSGASGTTSDAETFYRSELAAAEGKFYKLLRRKLKPHGPRRYNKISLLQKKEVQKDSCQMDLFPSQWDSGGGRKIIALPGTEFREMSTCTKCGHVVKRFEIGGIWKRCHHCDLLYTYELRENGQLTDVSGF